MKYKTRKFAGTEKLPKVSCNSNFALCGLTFKFEKLYLRFMFVMADNFVFQNPAHRKLAERYTLATGLELHTFEFVSEGPKGRISKLVLYTQSNLRDFYILSFGDKDKFTGDIDDKAISNNGDGRISNTAF